MESDIHNAAEDHPELTGRETPVCLNCFTPVDPLEHFCPNCGQTTGQLTPYIPFVNIRYNYSIFGSLWRKVWYEKASLPMKVFSLFLIILCVPIMLIALPFVIAEKIRTRRCGYRNAPENSRNKKS